MPHPVLDTDWPDGDALRAWLSSNAVSIQVDTELVDEVMEDASASIYESIDPDKLPENTDKCPRSIARAIVLEAARLLYRRQSPHGMAAFGEVAVRLRTADVDVEKLIRPYTLDPEP
jgi:hypothetical protein